MGIQNVSTQDSLAPSKDNTNSTVEYWTDLIRQSLATAKAIQLEDSDDEDPSPALNEEIMNAPRRKSARDALAQEVAARLYPAPPDSLGPIIKYEKDVVLLRSL
jgi:hypothetical protein